MSSIVIFYYPNSFFFHFLQETCLSEVLYCLNNFLVWPALYHNLCLLIFLLTLCNYHNEHTVSTDDPRMQSNNKNHCRPYCTRTCTRKTTLRKTQDAKTNNNYKTNKHATVTTTTCFSKPKSSPKQCNTKAVVLITLSQQYIICIYNLVQTFACVHPCGLKE